jgi:hypothetical protein
MRTLLRSRHGGSRGSAASDPSRTLLRSRRTDFLRSLTYSSSIPTSRDWTRKVAPQSSSDPSRTPDFHRSGELTPRRLTSDPSHALLRSRLFYSCLAGIEAEALRSLTYSSSIRPHQEEDDEEASAQPPIPHASSIRPVLRSPSASPCAPLHSLTFSLRPRQLERAMQTLPPLPHIFFFDPDIHAVNQSTGTIRTSTPSHFLLRSRPPSRRTRRRRRTPPLPHIFFFDPDDRGR